MSNLKSLREKIKNITDYSPDLQQYNDQLDELINDAYYDIWTTKRWNFATKEYFFKFYPDMLPTRDVITPGATITAALTKGDRQVVFSAAMDRLTSDVWEGQPIELQNYEYVISKVVSSTTILLDKVFHGTTDAASAAWIIKKRYYDLPHDSIELLSLAHRDIPSSTAGTGNFPPYGKLTGLMPRREEELNLRMDYAASYAEAYVWSPSFFVPEAYKLKLTAEDNELGTGFPQFSYLEVCWAFVKDGKVGALSEPETIYFDFAAATNSFTATFSSWDDQDIVSDTYQTKDTRPSQFEGLQKLIFWNSNFNRITGERLGLPVWRVFNNPGGSTIRNQSVFLDAVVALDTDATVTVANFNQIDPGNDIYIENDGQYNRIRPYPRVDAWDEEVSRQIADVNYTQVDQDFLREGFARYYYKPAHLGYATDSPEMPAEFHHLIVYKALETLYDKVGSLANAEHYRRKMDKEIKQLQKRYTDHIDSVVRRGQFTLVGNRMFAYDNQSLKSGG